ncbi:hypothetical protein BISA_2357 [Bifidobacterium saguini DSM 23967]|uniref:DUF4192 family protein n=1 Tax=Bifidobacterium saguini DSM 23967 TaxID=1437607 RepID=A0A087D328_9BIFI|nr:hypothetical protein [Bifidobacterium saguini]KFI89928.1 hypothetical protein BISA_2357 [Bifidobacterium saguini DSM 23967]
MTVATAPAKQTSATIRTRFHKLIMSKGRAKAIELMAADAMGAWMYALDYDKPLEPEHQLMLTTLMNEQLSVRDAMIAVTLDPDLLGGEVMQLASHPHQPDNRKRITEILTAAFMDAAFRPDTDRLTNAAAIMLQAANDADGKTSCQPLATAAYCAWLAGDMKAATLLAATALGIDEETNLACIVLYAIEHNDKPAYMR